MARSNVDENLSLDHSPKKRELNLPAPRSIAELLAKSSSYEMPKLLPITSDGHATGDGIVLASFSGYYQDAEGRFHKVQIIRKVGQGELFEIKMEEPDGGYKEWSTKHDELNIKNFGEDLYSLVLGLPDGRLFYFKFLANRSVLGYNGTHFRVLKGWLLSKADVSAQVSKVALIDHWDSAEWPSLISIRTLLPDDVLPGDEH